MTVCEIVPIRAALPSESEPLADIALNGVYLPDSRHTKAARQITPTLVEVDFQFNAYSRTIRQPDHVSAVQIHAALLEGCFCVMASATAAGAVPKGFDMPTFLETRFDWLLVHQECLFRKMLPAGSDATLKFELTDARRQILRQHFLRFDFGITGCVSATQSWLLPASKLPRN